MSKVPAAKLRLYQRMKVRQIAEARADPAKFVEYCFVDEKTGRPIKNAPFHEEWHRFFTENRRGVIEAAIEHGKSVQISLGRLIWEIGKDPELRCLCVAANKEARNKISRNVRKIIDYNKRVREVFPRLRKSRRKEDPWSDSDIVVERKSLARDPTVQFRTAGSKGILSSRLDLILIDDLLGFENTRTKAARDSLHEWFDDVISTRLVDDYENQIFGRIYFIGNPWHVDDLMARLKGLPGWAYTTTACVENPTNPPHLWRPKWPQKWPLSRILDRRAIMLPSSFARKFLCKVLDSAQRRFRWEWIQHMLNLGRGREFLRRRPVGRYGESLKCFTGLDPASGEGDSNALSSLFTIALDHLSRRLVVDIRTGHWTGPELLDEVELVCRAFDSELFVEGNQVQRWMAQFARDRGIASHAVNTGSDKWDEELGVESLAVEMRAGLWVAPSGRTGNDAPQEVREWVQECYDFDPSAHTGDRLMASWIALKGARKRSRSMFQRSGHSIR